MKRHHENDFQKPKHRHHLTWLTLGATPAQASFLSGETPDKAADIIALVVLFVVPIALIVVFWLVHILPPQNTTLAELNKAIETWGYKPRQATSDAPVDKQEEAQAKEYRKLMKKFWFAAAISVFVMITAYYQVVPFCVIGTWTHCDTCGVSPRY